MRVLTHLSLENFRLFKDRTSFDLAPITILTGTNSSGKSSLIKAILLLKSNFEKNGSIEQIDFSIGGHNLNDFKNSLNYDKGSDTMYFTFSSHGNDLGLNLIQLGYKLNKNDNEKGELDSFVIYSPFGELILAASKEFDDEIGGNITYKIDLNYFINNLNHEDLNAISKYRLKPNDTLFEINPGSHEAKVYFDALIELKQNGIRRQTGFTEYEMRHYNQSIVEGIGSLGQEVINWLSLNLKHKKIDSSRTDFGDFIYKDFSNWILKIIIKNIFYNFDTINHFSSIRSDSRKYYSEREKMLLDFFLKYKEEEEKFNPEIQEFIKHQLKEFSFGEKIDVDVHKNIVAEVFVIINKRKVILSDLGYGYTQLLPIIMKIGLAAHLNGADIEDVMAGAYDREPPYYQSLFLLEEPESNLHPAFQSKIADMVAYATSKFRISFIIETHSEYLIRNLQYLVSKGETLNSDQVKIFYFNKPGSDEAEDSLFKTIKIEANGQLTSGFGSGFFDESDNIAFDLFLLNQNRKN